MTVSGKRRSWDRLVRTVGGACAVALAVAPHTPAQTPDRGGGEGGRPFVTVFTRADYGAAKPIWALTEDSRGVLFAGNDKGVLEYDGATWRLTPLPNGRVVRSLDRDGDGRIWVGGVDYFGFLAPDSLGRTTFVSLRSRVPEPEQAFRDVWSVASAGGQVYFQASEALFGWDGTEMRVWRTATSFGRVSGVGDVVYVSEFGRGLLQIDAGAVRGEPRLVPGGERFAEMSTVGVLPFRSGGAESLLVATADGRLHVRDGDRFSRLRTGVDASLAETGIYTATFVPGETPGDDLYVLGTRRAGLYVIDPQGRLVHDLRGDSEYLARTILGSHVGSRGEVWVGVPSGVVHVGLGSPFTRLDPAGGQGTVANIAMAMARHDGQLYAANRYAPVTVLDSLTGAFVPVAGSPGYSNALVATRDGVLVSGGADGVFYLQDGRAVAVPRDGPYASTSLVEWSREPGTVFVGRRDGLGVLRWGAGGWADEGLVPGVDLEVWALAEGADGTLWLNNGAGSVGRLTLSESARGWREEGDLTVYGRESGLPEGLVYPRRVGDQVYFNAPGEPLRTFDAAAGRFVVDSAFAASHVSHRLATYQLREGEDGRVWVAPTYGAPTVTDPDVDAVTVLDRFRRAWVHDVYPDRDGVVWLMGDGDVIRYDTSRDAEPAAPPLIRRVHLGNDRLLYAGWSLGDQVPQGAVPFGSDRVRFEYAAPGGGPRPRYRTRLEGFDDGWSAWTDETERSYTNLPPGEYRFVVRAEGRPGRAVYALTVVPPWTRTPWARALFVGLAALSALGLGALVVRVRTARLQARQRRLERRVADQTLEIQARNARLAQQADQLRELSDAKARFFANVSHELRTPITLLLGPIDDLRRGRFVVDAQARPLLDRAAANGRRLRRLVEDLLTLTRADAGALTVHRRPLDVAAFVRARVAAFGSRPAAAGVALTFEAPGPVAVAADPVQIETVVYNLVDNAVKFTPEGGAVAVRVEPATGGGARLAVSDTGVGMAESDLAHLFERFYQGDTDQVRVGEGAGIGLALVREIVELHGGTVEAESVPGEGTTVTVTLPAGEVDAGDEDAVLAAPSPPPPVRPPSGDGAADGEPPELDVEDGRPEVLVVEDNPDLRAYLQSLLDDRYRVGTAADGAAGIAAAVDRIPDLVVSDVMMPGVDGFTLLTTLKADVRTSHVPVMMLTARADAESRLAGLAGGADAYLAKPFSGAELEATVASLLANRARLRRAWAATEAPVPEDRVPDAGTLSSIDAQFLERVHEAVEVGLDDPAFGAGTLAEAVGLSPRQLRRKLKALTDETPGALVRRARVERAADLLASGAASVKEAGYRVGFESENGFRDAFRGRFGVAPSDYADSNGRPR